MVTLFDYSNIGLKIIDILTINYHKHGLKKVSERQLYDVMGKISENHPDLFDGVFFGVMTNGHYHSDQIEQRFPPSFSPGTFVSSQWVQGEGNYIIFNEETMKKRDLKFVLDKNDPVLEEIAEEFYRLLQ